MHRNLTGLIFRTYLRQCHRRNMSVSCLLLPQLLTMVQGYATGTTLYRGIAMPLFPHLFGNQLMLQIWFFSIQILYASIESDFLCTLNLKIFDVQSNSPSAMNVFGELKDMQYPFFLMCLAR